MTKGSDLVSSQDPLDRLKGVRICCVAHVPYHMVSHLKAQVEYLRDAGMDVLLVCSAGPELSKIRLGPGLRHEAVEIPRTPKPGKDLVALIKLIRIFARHRFDIVHSTTPKAGMLSAMAAFLARVPVRLHTWTGQQWVTLRGPMRLFSRMADRLIGLLNTGCYADSESQSRFLVAERIVADRKIGVIGQGSLSGIDLTRFDAGRWPDSEKDQLRRRLSISQASRVIAYVGRITRDKGIFELVFAFHELLRSGTDVDLLLIGPFDQEVGGASSIGFDQKDPNPRIHYIGYAEFPETYLAIADVFCLPSYREGFGTTVIEAAAMGIPTVGTRINGLTDAVVDMETGVLVPPYDAPALAEALKSLLSDPDRLRRMGIAARERCVRLFDAKVVNGGLAREYVRILGGRSARAGKRGTGRRIPS